MTAAIPLELTSLSGVSIGDRFTFVVEGDKAITLGRADGCELMLSDPRVSRQHAQIFLKNTNLMLQDLGSSAGTVLMGFRLTPGEGGSKELTPGDEFKLGETIFRVEFSKPEQSLSDVVSETTNSGDSSLSRVKDLLKSSPYAKYGLLLLLVLPLLFFLIPEEKKPALPKQRSHIVVELPAERLLGYWPGKSKTAKTKKDSYHLDKVQFALPASDIVVEYAYVSQVGVKVFLDQSEIDFLEPYPSGSVNRSILIRDVLAGEKRRLIFDNPQYPAAAGKPKAKPPFKKWAVRNVRATPLVDVEDRTVESELQGSTSLLGTVNKLPESLFILSRHLQRATLKLMEELNIDALPVAIKLDDDGESKRFEPEVLSASLETILAERKSAEGSFEVTKTHLDELLVYLSRVESELWRRVKARFRQIEYSAKAKNYLRVYDNILAIKAMFPGDSDPRWVKANAYLKNKKYVPKKLLKNPARYRSRQQKKFR